MQASSPGAEERDDEVEPDAAAATYKYRMAQSNVSFA